MATERDRYELDFELIGGPEFESNARSLLDLVKNLENTLKGLGSTGGGKIGAAQLFEASAVGSLDQQITKLQKAQAALAEYRAELKAAAQGAQARYQDYSPRINNDGTVHATDAKKQERLREAAIRAQTQLEIENEKQAHLRLQLEQAQVGALRGLANATQARLKREQAETGKGSPAFIQANALTRRELDEYRQPLTPISGAAEPQRAQVALANARAAEAAVLTRMTRIEERNAAGQLTEIQTRDALSGLQRQLTGAMERRVIAEERVAAESGGFGGQFARGFKGTADRPYAEQLGQAVKFSAFYGAAYRLQSALLQTFGDALQEGIAFQQGLSDMALATGRSKTELTGLANNLAQIASATGQSPGAGVQTGARAIGLYGATQAPLDQQAYIAQLSTSIVGKLAFGTKQDPLTLQQNLASITSAAGLGVNGQVLIANLDAYFSKRFGTTPGDTLEAGAQSASAGIAAGFSPEQIQALAALIISRTGQTSSAVGGYLAQIFTRGGEGSLTSSAEALGIKTNGRALAAVFKDLATLYQQADAQTRTKIAATLGRGKVQSAGIAALENYPEVLAAAKDAQDGKATGALDRSFGARINNIGGQLAILSSTFKEFARLLGDSGLLSVLGLSVEALQTLLEATNALLEVYDSLPALLKDFAGALVVATIASRVFGTGSILGDAKGLLGIGAGAAGARNAQFAAKYITATTGAEVGAIGAGAAGGGIAATAAAVAPVAAAVAVLLGVGSLISTAKKSDAAQSAAAEIYRKAPALGSSAEVYRAQADAAAQIAQQNRDVDNGFLGKVAQVITFGHANDGAQRTAAQLDEEVARLHQVATDVAARDAANVDPSRRFATFDQAGVQAGLKEIADGGGSATVQLRALADAIDGLGKTAADTRGKLDKGTVGEYATGIGGGLSKALDGLNFTSTESTSGEVYSPKNVKGGALEKEIGKQLTNTKIQKRLQKFLDDNGITNLKELTPGLIAKFAAQLSNSVNYNKGDLGGLNKTDKSTIQHLLQDKISGYLYDVLNKYQEAIQGDSPLASGTATQIAQELIGATAARTALRPNTDYKGRAADARGLLGQLRKLLSRVPGDQDTSQLEVLIGQARQTLVQQRVAELDALEKAAISRAKNQAEATKIGKSFVSQKLRLIINYGGTSDDLAAVLAAAGKGAVAIAKREILHALQVAEAALATQKALNDAANVLAAALGPIGFGAFPGASDADNKKAAAAQAEIDRIKGLATSLNTSSSDRSPYALPGGSEKKSDDPDAVRHAKLAAEAARKGGAIAAAQSDLESARSDLAKAKKNTIAYYEALQKFYAAQDSLRDALRQYAYIRAQLRIDTTDPLAQARLDLQVARNKLISDIKKGKGKDVIAQDRLDVKNAQNSAEATKFDQRLQDIQTAESLGRITHGAYLSYLQSEHNRLVAIAHKTRQQKDELNQIDQLLKEAQSSLQGAFNIGDIKLPTPYEVRRYIKSQIPTPGPGYEGGRGGNTTTIYIDGADIGKVNQIIKETVGKSSRVLTTTTRRN